MYRANGGGSVILNAEVPADVINALNDVFTDVEDAPDGGLWLTLEYDGYDEDGTERALSRLAPYVKSGKIEYCGDYEEYWRYVFEDGKVYYEAGHITYTRSYEVCDMNKEEK